MTDEIVNPITDFGFAVQIEGIEVGWFTECSGITLSREVKAHPEGGVNDYVHQLPGPIKHQSLTLKRGVADETLWQWLQEGVFDGKVKRCNISVILYGVDKSEARRWDLTNAYPIKWKGFDLKADSNKIAIESLELVQDNGGSDSAAETVQRQVIEQAEPEQSAASATNEVDLEALAHKVYALLKQDLRVERERLGHYRS